MQVHFSKVTLLPNLVVVRLLEREGLPGWGEEVKYSKQKTKE